MNARLRANFINSVADTTKIPCPRCQQLNESDSKFCFSCGTTLLPESKNTENQGISLKSQPDGGQIHAATLQAFAAEEVISSPDQKEESVFAQGLPAWNLVPPQVPVRRIRRK